MKSLAIIFVSFLVFVFAAPTPPVCPKCGIFKKSGKTNCCAGGGAWFNQCGDVGDSNFDHTWFEGKEACKRKLIESAIECKCMHVQTKWMLI